jgi:hypothetical protein
MARTPSRRSRVAVTLAVATFLCLFTGSFGSGHAHALAGEDAGTPGTESPMPPGTEGGTGAGTTPITAPITAPITTPGEGNPVENPHVEPGRPGTPAPWARVVVDLSDQQLTVFDTTGRIAARWKVSTGAAETPTPLGRYRVTSKSRRTFATKNPRVTMEHMVRFHGGIGFHSIPRLDGTPLATPLGERGVSHGCIRLADRNARTLYRNLPLGAEVVVTP